MSLLALSDTLMQLDELSVLKYLAIDNVKREGWAKKDLPI